MAEPSHRFAPAFQAWSPLRSWCVVNSARMPNPPAGTTITDGSKHALQRQRRWSNSYLNRGLRSRIPTRTAMLPSRLTPSEGKRRGSSRGSSRRSADARHHRACASGVRFRPLSYGLSVACRNPPDDCTVAVSGSGIEPRRPDANLVSDEPRYRTNTLPKEH